MLKGFRDFIMRGNVVDLAVAVVIGAAFGALVTSFTDDILMQAIAAVVGQPDFSDIVIGPIRIGSFLTALLNFLLIASAIYFFVVAPMNRIFPDPAPAPTKECPECLTAIPEAARRCPACTAQLL